MNNFLCKHALSMAILCGVVFLMVFTAMLYLALTHPTSLMLLFVIMFCCLFIYEEVKL